MQFINLKAQYARIKTEVTQGIEAVLEHGQYIMGPEVSALESALAQFIGSEHAISCASGTDALLVALLALDVGPGDEVITSPFSFFATAEVISLIGAKPVFVDIDPDTYNLDPSLLASAITPKTKAIMPVSLYGQCADYDAINVIANHHQLPVIEDCAQSFGARYKGRYSGALTTVSATSFFPSKPLGAYGDGGALFTHDDELAQRIRQIRLHGQSRRYEHVRLGINGRMDSMQAAVLQAKLKIFPEEVELREAIGRRYTELLSQVVKTPVIHPDNISVFAQYTIEVDNRETFAARMQAAGVPTAVHYPKPLHHQPVYANQYEAVSMPVTEAASERVISLPMHPYLSEAEQDEIVAAVKQVVTS